MLIVQLQTHNAAVCLDRQAGVIGPAVCGLQLSSSVEDDRQTGLVKNQTDQECGCQTGQHSYRQVS